MVDLCCLSAPGGQLPGERTLLLDKRGDDAGSRQCEAEERRTPHCRRIALIALNDQYQVGELPGFDRDALTERAHDRVRRTLSASDAEVRACRARIERFDLGLALVQVLTATSAKHRNSDQRRVAGSVGHTACEAQDLEASSGTGTSRARSPDDEHQCVAVARPRAPQGSADLVLDAARVEVDGGAAKHGLLAGADRDVGDALREQPGELRGQPAAQVLWPLTGADLVDRALQGALQRRELGRADRETKLGASDRQRIVPLGHGRADQQLGRWLLGDVEGIRALKEIEVHEQPLADATDSDDQFVHDVLLSDEARAAPVECGLAAAVDDDAPRVKPNADQAQ